MIGTAKPLGMIRYFEAACDQYLPGKPGQLVGHEPNRKPEILSNESDEG
jgi:hypothetical protein